MRELRALGWDWAGEPLLVLKKEHLLRVMDRYLAREISAEQLQEWAENLEGREDVVFDQKEEESLDSVFFRIATPEINDPLTSEIVRQMRNELLQERG